MAAVVKCHDCGNWYSLTETGPIRCPICKGFDDLETLLVLTQADVRDLRAMRIKPEPYEPAEHDI